ncbi:unnamed protein product, partial [Ixodes persulcatus]
MVSGTSGGYLLLVAFICQGLGCSCQAQANTSAPSENTTSASARNHSSFIFDTVTYPVTDGGSSPLISGIGVGILDSLADTPTDATLLELTSFSPDYDTVRDYIKSKHSAISSFITYLWVALGVFIVVIVVIFLMRLASLCGARRQQRITENYMLAFVFYAISLTVLFILCLMLLVWLIITREAMNVALKEWAPDLYNSTFLNLKLFVNLTLGQIADSRKRQLPFHNVSRVLGPDFDRTFEKFIASSVMEDARVPLHHMARDCATDHRYLGRVLNAAGHHHLGVTFRKIGDQCARVHRDNEELFGNVVEAVARTTAPYRLKLLEILADSMSTLDASDVDVSPSYTSIDMLQMKLQGFEEYHGVYKYLTEKAVVWLLVLVALFFVALALLVICLLTGIAVHRQFVQPQKRSKVSNFVGHMLIVTAYVFSAFVILAILTVIYLTIYNTLGYCHFCGPYLKKDYAILDDAIDRMWPVGNRSQLLSKIIPSEIASKCQNESVSIFDLGPVPSHRRTFHYHSLAVPQVRLQGVLQKLTLRERSPIVNDSLSSHEDLFQRLLLSIRNVSFTDNRARRDVQRTARRMHDKWHNFWARSTMPRLTRTSIERVLVPMVPSYFRRFIKRVTQDVNNSNASKPAVIGPCFIVSQLITSVMDVVCKGFVIELVGYWATLLFSFFSAILIIIICFLFSKYFFRTHERRKRTSSGRLTSSLEESESTETTESSGPSSSLVVRTIFVRTDSRTSPIPFDMPIAYNTSVSSLHVHSPMPFSSSLAPMVVRSCINRFASVPAIMHYHPFVSLTSQTSMHPAICSGASSHGPLHRISSLTAIHSTEHTHDHLVTPVRHAHSCTTVETLLPPPPQRVIIATPPLLPPAPI